MTDAAQAGSADDLRALSDRDWFAAQVRNALMHLYDARVLRASPLGRLAGLDPSPETAPALRERIIAAIERLRPASSDGPQAHPGRVYQILRRRYIQQLTQERVALDIGLSVRQLQREEQAARAELADLIWDAWRLERQSALIRSLRQSHPVGAESDDWTDPAWAQELLWLEHSAAPETCRVEVLLAEVLEIARPALQALGAHVSPADVAARPPVLLRVAIARQALLTLLTALARRAPGSRIAVDVEWQADRVLFVASSAGERAGATLDDEEALSLSRLKRLINSIGGELVVQPLSGGASGWIGRLVLPVMPHPVASPVDVLVIDDNPDALRLFERYLAGTRYRFLGAQSASEALQLVDARQPSLVVLDVMMPDQDGWSLLVRLRQRYRSRAPAIVVCSILGQKDVALNLGADDLLLKPVARQALLETLNRQWQRLAPSAG